MVDLSCQRLLFAAVFAVGVVVSPFQNAKADDPGFIASWSVEPSFDGKDKIRESISGAACAPVSPPACLVALDEQRNTQFFAISGKTIVPGPVMRLLPKKEGGIKYKEIDAEGAAYADGYFYVMGSHGLSRKKAKFNPSSFFIFRFPVDPKTREATFKVSSKTIAREIERSDRLREAIKAAPGAVGAYAEKPLGEGAGGVTLEGLAVAGKRMYLGFRGPSVEGTAFIMDVDARAVFSSGDLSANVTDIALGAGAGVRDLAPVSDGLLVLAGPVQKKGRYAIHHLSFQDQKLRKLLDLTMPNSGAKAETILLLAEQSDSYNVLVLYDGLLDGGPREYRFGR
ncbi:MAG: DUF3616 domain-containing protein [Roseibium sp.]